MSLDELIGPAGAPQRFTDDNLSGGPNGTNWSDPDVGIPKLASRMVEHIRDALIGKSTTSLTIGDGTKSLTVDRNRPFQANSPLRLASDADAGNYMTGRVTSYDPATGALVVAATAHAGTGSHADWTVSLDFGAEIDDAVSATAAAAASAIRQARLAAMRTAAGERAAHITTGAAATAVAARDTAVAAAATAVAATGTVKVTASDTGSSVLNSAVSVSDGTIVKTVVNPGGDETLDISVNPRIVRRARMAAALI